MATLIPPLAGIDRRRMLPGERGFARRIESHLEDDYFVWHDVPIGPRQSHPDFVLLHARRGLLILEVKDWKLDTIQRADRDSFTLITARGPIHVKNPLEQARDYAFEVKELLERDLALVAAPGDRYAGKLKVPYGYGVVLTRITRQEFERENLGEVLEPSKVLCQDEMAESVEVEAFQSRLWSMFNTRPFRPLTLPEIDRIRWHLFPEIRIQQGRLDFGDATAAMSITQSLPDLVRVMDLQQEQLARSLGEGHRVIHGVAGSGKTLILGYRCQHLAGLLAKPILVLCFNVALATQLARLMEERRLSEKVAVRNFHAWCHDQLKLYGIEKPEDGEDFFDRLVEGVIRGVDRGQVPRSQYGAVMIDEGHDFRPEWLRLAAQMVDPETNALLVLYDDAQSIYEKRARGKFSFKSVGIQAQGRTTILRLNYRNTAEVLAVAHHFAREVLTPEAADDDGIPLIAPASAGRRGPPPELLTMSSLKAETRYIAERLRKLHDKGIAWNAMAALYHRDFVGDEMAHALERVGIPLNRPQRGRMGAKRFVPTRTTSSSLPSTAARGSSFPSSPFPASATCPRSEGRRRTKRDSCTSP